MGEGEDPKGPAAQPPPPGEPVPESAEGGAAFHGAELIVLGRIAGRNADVDAGSADGVALRQVEIRFLQDLDGVFHGP